VIAAHAGLELAMTAIAAKIPQNSSERLNLPLRWSIVVPPVGPSSLL